MAGLGRGTYARLWLLLALCLLLGLVGFWTLGSTEILWIACGVVVLLLYTALGEELNRRRPHIQFATLVGRGVASTDAERLWLVLDATGSVLAVSQAGSQALGLRSDEVVGRRIGRLVDGATSRAHAAELLRFAQLGRAWSGELVLIDRSGVPRHHLVRLVEWDDDEIQNAGLVAVGPQQPRAAAPAVRPTTGPHT